MKTRRRETTKPTTPLFPNLKQIRLANLLSFFKNDFSVPAEVENQEEFEKGEEEKRDEEATDLVGDTYHLLNEIPQPKNSESLMEKPFSDPAVPNVIILEAINHTVSSFLSPYLTEIAVVLVVLKHRWRWKEEEDAPTRCLTGES